MSSTRSRRAGTTNGQCQQQLPIHVTGQGSIPHSHSIAQSMMDPSSSSPSSSAQQLRPPPPQPQRAVSATLASTRTKRVRTVRALSPYEVPVVSTKSKRTTNNSNQYDISDHVGNEDNVKSLEAQQQRNRKSQDRPSKRSRTSTSDQQLRHTHPETSTPVQTSQYGSRPPPSIPPTETNPLPARGRSRKNTVGRQVITEYTPSATPITGGYAHVKINQNLTCATAAENETTTATNPVIECCGKQLTLEDFVAHNIDRHFGAPPTAAMGLGAVAAAAAASAAWPSLDGSPAQIVSKLPPLVSSVSVSENSGKLTTSTSTTLATIATATATISSRRLQISVSWTPSPSPDDILRCYTPVHLVGGLNADGVIVKTEQDQQQQQQMDKVGAARFVPIRPCDIPMSPPSMSPLLLLPENGKEGEAAPAMQLPAPVEQYEHCLRTVASPCEDWASTVQLVSVVTPVKPVPGKRPVANVAGSNNERSGSPFVEAKSVGSGNGAFKKVGGDVNSAGFDESAGIVKDESTGYPAMADVSVAGVGGRRKSVNVNALGKGGKKSVYGRATPGSARAALKAKKAVEAAAAAAEALRISKMAEGVVVNDTSAPRRRNQRVHSIASASGPISLSRTTSDPILRVSGREASSTPSASIPMVRSESAPISEIKTAPSKRKRSTSKKSAYYAESDNEGLGDGIVDSNETAAHREVENAASKRGGKGSRSPSASRKRGGGGSGKKAKSQSSTTTTAVPAPDPATQIEKKSIPSSLNLSFKIQNGRAVVQVVSDEQGEESLDADETMQVVASEEPVVNDVLPEDDASSD
ncbi:hypothetical protein HDU76_007446, partial [Blyttiomyces sp. JEL0837]